MAYQAERQAFANFKAYLEANSGLRSEYETAIASVVAEYNTTLRENRFIAGGAVEVFTAWAMRAAGIDVEHVGPLSAGADLRLTGGEGLSMKAVFVSPPVPGRRDGRTTNLVNVLGDIANAKWHDATLFVIAGTGLVYADPELLPDAAITQTGGALVVHLEFVLALAASRPEFHCALSIATKPDRVAADAKVASQAVAYETVMSKGLTELQRGFTPPHAR